MSVSTGLRGLPAAFFGVPMALVSLVDGRRQWFKSRQGLDACETSREISFCGHAITAPGVFVVEDALEDSRFADNPLVLGEPFIRFYADYPLTMPNGSRIGTLCVLDAPPRQFTGEDREILIELARLVEGEINTMAMATTDEISGLSNSRGFRVVGDTILAVTRRLQHQAALLMLDLDGLKRINDVHGHADGDLAINAFGRCLLKSFRDSDVVARIGGDEFCVLLTAILPEQVDTALSNLRRQVAVFNATLAGSGHSNTAWARSPSIPPGISLWTH